MLVRIVKTPYLGGLLGPVASDLVPIYFDDFDKRQEDGVGHEQLNLPGPLTFFRGAGSRLSMPSENVVLVAHSGWAI